MKIALVCKNQEALKYDNTPLGYRVAEVWNESPAYEPAPDHMYVECSDDVEADQKWFNPIDNTFNDFPVAPIVEKDVAQNQPTTTGTQTL
jgi:hypothetical protein